MARLRHHTPLTSKSKKLCFVFEDWLSGRGVRWLQLRKVVGEGAREPRGSGQRIDWFGGEYHFSRRKDGTRLRNAQLSEKFVPTHVRSAREPGRPTGGHEEILR